MKKTYKILGWSRDAKGKVVRRPMNDYVNAITSTVDHSIGYDSIGMGNTTPYVFERYERDKVLCNEREMERQMGSAD